MEPIHTFIDNFNKGDLKAAGQAYTAEALILDEMPPHLWRGPAAFTDWVTSGMQDAQAKGLTDEGVNLSAPERAEINGGHSYVVVPAMLKFRDHGKAMIEPAHMVFSLTNDCGAWKISSWAWAGTTPQPVGGTP